MMTCWYHRQTIIWLLFYEISDPSLISSTCRRLRLAIDPKILFICTSTFLILWSIAAICNAGRVDLVWKSKKLSLLDIDRLDLISVNFRGDSSWFEHTPMMNFPAIVTCICFNNNIWLSVVCSLSWSPTLTECMVLLKRITESIELCRGIMAQWRL